jgi:hypothetical protein
MFRVLEADHLKPDRITIMASPAMISTWGEVSA